MRIDASLRVLAFLGGGGGEVQRWKEDAPIFLNR